MANLLAGTTIDGYILWHSGNLSVDDLLRNPRAPGNFYVMAGQTAYGQEAAISLAVGDHDTGLNWLGDGALAVMGNGVERMRFTVSGKIGVGTTNPASALDVVGEVRATTLTASTQINLPAVGAAAFTSGGVDGATYAGHNTRLGLWWGMGVADQTTGVIKAVLNARAGTWRLKGGVELGPDDNTLLSLTREGEGTLSVSNGNGYVQIGAKNQGAAHIYTDRPYFSFNRPLVASSFFQLGDGSKSIIAESYGLINGKLIVTTDDTRLKSWGNWATDGGNNLTSSGKTVLTGGGNTVFLNNTGDHTGGVVVNGAGLTVNGVLGVAGNAFFGRTTVQGGNDLVLQAPAGSSDAGDIVFTSVAGAEYARIYTGTSGDSLDFRVQGDSKLRLTADRTVSNYGITAVAKSGAADNTLYYRAGLMTQTNDGSLPAISFHRAGYDAIALFKGTDNRLYVQEGNVTTTVVTTRDTEWSQLTGNRLTTLADGADLGASRPTGVYAGSNLVGAPSSSWHYVWNAQHSDPAYMGQTALSYFSNDFYFRRRVGGTWNAWQKVWSSGDFDPTTFATTDGVRAFTGTISASSGSFPLAFGGSGRNWIFHRSDASTLWLAPSVTVGAGDWDWANGLKYTTGGVLSVNGVNTSTLVFDASAGEKDLMFVTAPGKTSYFYGSPGAGGTVGLYDSDKGGIWTYSRTSNVFNVNKVLSTSGDANVGGGVNALSGTFSNGGSALSLTAGNNDHVYLALYPRTNNPNLRGAFIGFGGAGTSNLTLANEMTNVAWTIGGATSTNASLTVTADTGADDSSLFSRANVIVQTSNGSNPAIGFWKQGTDAVSLKYKGGADLYLQYGVESRLWHSGNFNPASKLDSAAMGLWGTNGGQDLLARGGRAMAAAADGGGNRSVLFINYGGDFPNGVIVNGAMNVTGVLSQNGAAVWHTGNFDPSTKAAASHTHAISEVGGLQNALDGKAASSHTHAIVDVQGLQGALDAKLTAAAGSLSGNWTVSGTLTATDFLKSSARALKQDIHPYQQDALSEVAALDIVTFRYRSDPATEHVGIIADDTPNSLISGENHDHFNTANALAIALKAIQELKARVESQDELIAKLELICNGR